MPEVIFKHSLTDPDSTRPTLTDIANTLIAHEKVARLIGEFLDKSLDGLTVERVNIDLCSAEIGSLYEHFLVALLVVYQKDFNKEVPEVIEALTGYKLDERFDTLVTVVLLLLLFWGARYITTRVTRKDAVHGASLPAPPAIQGDYNTYINIAADKLSVTSERIEEAVEAVAKGTRRQTLSRAAIDLFRPAKRGGNGRIVPVGTPEVSAAAVAEFPNEAILADLDQDTEVEPFPNVVLEIRATDRDKRKQGWAGILRVDELEKKRAPVTLYPTVNVDDLAHCELARVDALAEFKVINEDDRVLIHIHVLVVHECLDQSSRLPLP